MNINSKEHTLIVRMVRQIDSATKSGADKRTAHPFYNQPKRSSGHQLHFENRQVLGVEFLCKPVDIRKGHRTTWNRMKIDHVKVNNIRQFLYLGLKKEIPAAC